MPAAENNLLTRILIVDDDLKLRELIAEYLKEYGFEIFFHEDGNGVLEKINDVQPELVLLDVMLPVKDGIEILREIRGSLPIPVIMLTAKGDDTDRIVGLELGADDYISKPFNPRELLARIKAVLRRYGPENESQYRLNSGQRITAKGLVLDPLSMKLEYGKKSLELSKTEFQILEALMSNPNTVLSRDTIMNIARGKDFIAFDRSIDVHISKLRTKIENLSGEKNCIKTVWGTGYMFVL
jgi:two-component system phosphate regulon response regulator OmpR